ncbi:RluA family pseudouridine synthase, partial [Prevotella sp.]|uniref:RluA family pseudouridine synthase n=1 Tax=Prevotella sp. TaxID=59823 RepID=UPI002A7F1EEF
MAVDGYDADASDDETGQLYEHFRFEADPGMQPLRVDKYMCEKLPHSSRNRIQTAADAGFVHVNGRPVKSNFKVRPGDVVTLMLDRPRHDTSIVAEDLPINVVYEDDDLMVVNKEAGMVVHPGAGNFTGTLVNAIAWHLRNVESYDPNDPEVGLVHRIDKDTSGLLVVAKTPKAKTSLGLQFFNKTTHRSYNAVVWGRSLHPSESCSVGVVYLVIYGMALVYVSTHGIEPHGVLTVSLEVHRVVLVRQQMVGEMLVDIIAGAQQRPPTHILRIVLESDIVSQCSAR